MGQESPELLQHLFLFNIWVLKWSAPLKLQNGACHVENLPLPRTPKAPAMRTPHHASPTQFSDPWQPVFWGVTILFGGPAKKGGSVPPGSWVRSRCHNSPPFFVSKGDDFTKTAQTPWGHARKRHLFVLIDLNGEPPPPGNPDWGTLSPTFTQHLRTPNLRRQLVLPRFATSKVEAKVEWSGFLTHSRKQTCSPQKSRGVIPSRFSIKAHARFRTQRRPATIRVRLFWFPCQSPTTQQHTCSCRNCK